MYLVKLTTSDGRVFYLGRGLPADLVRADQPSDRYYWFCERDHQRIIQFATPLRAYRAYQVAYKCKGDRFSAEPVQASLAVAA